MTHRRHSLLYAVKKLTREVKALVREREVTLVLRRGKGDGKNKAVMSVRRSWDIGLKKTELYYIEPTLWN